VAVWQFNVAFVPQSWIDSGGAVASLFEEEGGFDPALAWRRYDTAQLEEALSRVLSKGKSWHSDLTILGKAEADDIQLWRRDGKVESVQVRFDLRRPNMALFREVVDIAREFELVILVLETKRVVTSDTRRLLRAAAESAAAHFVIDPESFLLQVEATNAKAT
jgi:hypothetical protein